MHRLMRSPRIGLLLILQFRYRWIHFRFRTPDTNITLCISSFLSSVSSIMCILHTPQRLWMLGSLFSHTVSSLKKGMCRFPNSFWHLKAALSLIMVLHQSGVHFVSVVEVHVEQAKLQLWDPSVLSALPRKIILSLLPVALVDEMEHIRVVYILLGAWNSSWVSLSNSINFSSSMNTCINYAWWMEVWKC